MNKYYQVIATLEGNKETLFGSFDIEDCKYEIEVEKESWKQDGYKAIKIEVLETQDTPDEDVYSDVLVTKDELFMQQAPSFNFELNKGELLERALESGYVTKVHGKDDLYMINQDY